MISGWIDSSVLCLPMTKMCGFNFVLLGGWLFCRIQCSRLWPLSLRNRMRLLCQWSMNTRQRSSDNGLWLGGVWRISRWMLSAIGSVFL